MSQIPEEIIIRYFQRCASEEESQQLYAWLQQDEKNTELFYELEEVWNSRNTIDETVIRKGWERLHHIMQQKQDKLEIIHTPLKKRPVRIWYAAAACIGVLIIASLWLGSENGIINLGKPVVQNVVFNRNGTEMLLLPDSSRIWINENSKITYPEKFSKKERLVHLEGKAYFDITKNEQQPFIVRMNNIDVEVTGTEFFIETTPLRTLITLISGSVQVKRTDIKKSASLIPGQEAIIDTAKNGIDITMVDTDFYVAWKDGTYRFEDEPLEKIAKLLARHFDLKINMAEALEKKQFTGRVNPDDDIRDVLENISITIPIQYEINDKTVTIREK